MNGLRSSRLVAALLAVTVCLLAAAAPAPPEKRCYDKNGDEIPCPGSNYLQTQKAIRDASRDSGPTYTPVPPTYTLSPTPSTTPTPTVTATHTETPPPSATSAQLTLPATAASSSQTPDRPSLIQVLIPVLLLGLAGLIGIVLLVVLIRWLSGRGRPSP